MVNSLIERESGPLDDVFGALSHDARRSIVRRLLDGPATVSELGAPLEMSAPAVSRHLRVLEGAGLIDRAREGRIHRIRLRRSALEPAAAWLAGFWTDAFHALEAHLEEGDDDDG